MYSKEEVMKVLQSGALSESEEKELLALLEAEMKEAALNNNSVFAEEYIKITNKKGDQVSFVLNDIQKQIDAKMDELRAAQKLVRMIILKGRQHGVTTYAQGRMIKNTTTKKNRTGLIVAQKDDTCTTIFNKAKYMYDNLPANIKPLQRASNAKELVFDRPTGYKGKAQGLNSKIMVQVAGNVDIGRGDTPFYVHLSEVAFWPSPEGKEVWRQIAGILNAVPKTIDTEVCIESTANGFNDFKDLWDDAVSGKSEWTPMFFPWHANPDYRMDCTEDEYVRLINNLDKKIKDYIVSTCKLFNLCKEQIKWWIWTFKNDCHGDFNMMKQENPSMPEEAFISTGSPVFNNEKIQSRIAYLRQKYLKNPPKQGRFTFEWGNPDTKDYIKDNTIKWVEDPNGFVTIYEFPQSGYPYVLGGDTKGEGRDYYTGKVINNVTGNRAAKVRNRWSNSKPYTWQMYCLGMFYYMALISIEVNFNTAPIEELERLHYPRQYTRRKYDDLTKEYQLKHGWKTDGNTRPLIIDKEVHLIEENIDLFNDIEMLEECLTFVYDKDRPDAMPGKHDDILFADMIGNESRQQQSFEAEREIEPQHHSFDEDNQHNREDDEESPFN
jgi:hypothetical protein